jgi:hypothetical protein
MIRPFILERRLAMTGAWLRDNAETAVMSTVEGHPMASPAVVRVLAESPVMLLTEVTMSGTSPPHVEVKSPPVRTWLTPRGADGDAPPEGAGPTVSIS